MFMITWKLICYIFNSLIFRSRIVYRIHNLVAAQSDDYDPIVIGSDRLNMTV